MERLTYRRDADGRVCPNLKEGKDWLSHMKMVADKLCAYEDAEEQGIFARIDERFTLAMLAGARAIEQNPRKYFGATFVCDVFRDKPKKISYHDAAKMLREKAEAALKED